MINDVIVVAFIGMVVAQTIKVPILRMKDGFWDWRMVFSTGGMPSSHTAAIVATALQVGLDSGFDSPLFGLAFVCASVIIHDAVKVRGESGKQASQINAINDALGKLVDVIDVNISEEERDERLKELIGHTVSEVLGGILCGMLVVLIYNI